MGLPSSDHVASTFLLAFQAERVVGRMSLRHRLNAKLERIGGHIGYVVVPEFRGRGYATEILRQSLALAKDRLGLNRVLVTCDEDNGASRRVIEKHGGVLENVVTGPDLPIAKRRYWIQLPWSRGSTQWASSSTSRSNSRSSRLRSIVTRMKLAPAAPRICHTLLSYLRSGHHLAGRVHGQ